ncbi:heat shock 70 kDa protein 12B-like [Mytilus californianus]|uniref:heat shock 70 kDa protein 12B-like n=1 Tax=Mytilus californianus TaxID=6549 RepID=UPI002245186B|nr:heat shock 70 kDa protein 12B-like [Mytilus californianus]
MQSNHDKILVAAIDFGTTFSACACSFITAYKKNPLNIWVNHIWKCGSTNCISRKVPNAVLFDKSKKFLAFGYHAANKYTQFALDEKQHDYYYFCMFKMLLQETKHLTRHTMIKDDNGKEMSALEILSLVIKCLKNQLLETLKSEKNIEVYNDEIHWVLTVPAIWTESGKQFMREAEEKAGISGEHLLLCLKPEAASILCQHFLTDKIEDQDDIGNALTASEKGAKYKVLDLEDGTAEITFHQKDSHGNLLELQTTSGCPWVGPCIDEAFNQLLIKFVGAHHFRKFQKENKLQVIEMLNEFELKKTSISNESISKVTVAVPFSLLESFEKDTEEKIGDVIKQTAYEGKITWRADKLRIDAICFRALYYEPKTHLIKHIKSILTKSHLKDVNTILMVGSFSKSPIMQSAVKDAFPGMTVFAPPEPGLAVLEGAVLYGHWVSA